MASQLRSSIGQIRQKFSDLVCRHGFAVQISLNLDAAFQIQAPHLLFGLDTLGGGGHAEAHAKTGDGADNCEASFVHQQVTDKRLIDLDLVELKASQVADAGIASPEIIHRYPNAEIPQLIQDRDIALRLLEQYRF